MEDQGQNVQDQNLVDDSLLNDNSADPSVPQPVSVPDPVPAPVTTPAPAPATADDSANDDSADQSADIPAPEPVIPMPDNTYIEDTPRSAPEPVPMPEPQTAEAVPAPVPAPAPATAPVAPAPAEPATPRPATPAVPAIDTSAIQGAGSGDDNELMSVKQDALSQLTPIVDHLNLPPEEKFDTYMMIIRASDDKKLIKPAFDAAQAITDEDKKAQALLDVVNEVNYLTQEG